jgi:hypothetical protein
MSASFKYDPNAKDTPLPRWVPWVILLGFIALALLILWIKS